MNKINLDGHELPIPDSPRFDMNEKPYPCFDLPSVNTMYQLTDGLPPSVVDIISATAIMWFYDRRYDKVPNNMEYAKAWMEWRKTRLY